jgi:tripartite-type tricarboxylate transporter receptor subunit TctC
MVEAGVPDYVAPSFNGVVAPAGTPAGVTERLNEAINDILKTPDVAAEIQKLGGQINVGSPADFAAFIAVEAKRWLDVADTNNIKVD